MKRIYTIETNSRIYEAHYQEQLFDIIRKIMRVRNNVSLNISWKNVQDKRAYKVLDERKDEIIDMLCERKTYKDIAKKYGVSSSTVATFCRQNKLISHKALVYTEPEDRKEKMKAIETVWFGAKPKG